MEASDSEGAGTNSLEVRDPGAGVPRPWIVLKFGGTSVSSLACWETIAKVVRRRLDQGLRPLLVCSALSQVSNELEAALSTALEGGDPAKPLSSVWARHEELAQDLGLDPQPLLGPDFAECERRLRGVSLTREASPRLRAEISSCGELLSTHLGAAWLEAQGIAIRRVDARRLLDAQPDHDRPIEARFLSATCAHGENPGLQRRLQQVGEPVVLTQGFIVRGPDRGTALLGRGGSDTSAAYLAAGLGAERIEIWTDVPGIYSADPRRVEGARRLLRLGYAEAAEITTRGAKVLHPRCLEPARQASIPIHIRCTQDPEAEGTVIDRTGETDGASAIAIATRGRMAIVNLEVEGSWQQVGLLAEITGCLARHGYSIDAIASSPTRITVALDPAANPQDAAMRQALLGELERLANLNVVDPVASVSLIGTHLTTVLHHLPSLFECLRGQEEIYLMAHAANDRSLTFAVDESAADAIVRKLHGDLVAAWEDEAGIPLPACGRA